MSELPHDHIMPFKESAKTKKEQVAEMFDSIAGKYDFMNRFLSARTDVKWRRKAISMLKKYKPQQILDVATGTGDLAIKAYKILQPRQITGIDISKQMLEVGKVKINKEGFQQHIQLQQADSENIPFDSNKFDAVMAAFGVRNFENLEKGLCEMLRVLKPGGQLLIIEFSRPKSIVIKGLYNIYMKFIAPRIASAVTHNKGAYKYLNESVNAFPERSDFVYILNKLGFKKSQYQAQTFGICCIYTAEKL